MLIVLFNNLPQLVGLIMWSVLMIWAGRRWERWRTAHHIFHRASKEKIS